MMKAVSVDVARRLADLRRGKAKVKQIDNDSLTAEPEKNKQLKNQPISYSERDYETMKKTVYGHARHQPKDAQMGVACVILNRARSRRESGATIDEICREAGEFWIGVHGEPVIHNWNVYNSIDEWLPRLIKGEIQDLTNGAQIFLHRYDTHHEFLEDVEHVITLGTFIFYK